jgi:hypothetical protein
MNTTYPMEMGAGITNHSWLNPQQPVPCRGPIEVQLEALKERLVAPVLEAVTDTALVREIKWAATEAAALAWYSASPILFLPGLLEEKVRAAFQKWEKQKQVRGGCRQALCCAADAARETAGPARYCEDGEKRPSAQPSPVGRERERGATRGSFSWMVENEVHADSHPAYRAVALVFAEPNKFRPRVLAQRMGQGEPWVALEVQGRS